MSSSLEAKIVVLGAQGVGKTSLVQRYVRNAFNPSTTTSTVGASFVTKRVLDTPSDTVVRLQIWDTAGQERFRSISRLYYRGAHACLLCYDITDETSFQEMAGWLRELRRNLGTESGGSGGGGGASGGSSGVDEPLVIHVVGTKSDIVADDPSRRRVPFERTIAYVAEQLYPTQASTPPATAIGISNAGLGFGSGVFGGGGGGGGPGSISASAGSTSAIGISTSAGALQSPDSKRSSAFWGQEIGWDCCHEISAKDGEGIEEVFRVITRKLVEQRNRRDAEAAMAITPSVDGLAGLPTPSVEGSFRLGIGDKRRSWLGLATPSIEPEEPQITQARRQGRCC